MKKNKRKVVLKKEYRVLLVFILSILFVFYVKSFNFKNIKENDTSSDNVDKTTQKLVSHDYLGNFTNSTSKELDDSVKKLLIDFFNDYYSSMKVLSLFDSDKYFTSDSQDKLLYKTSLEVLIESRKRQLNDLSLSNAKYDLTINKIDNKSNSVYIELLEDSYIDFSFLDFTSKVYNILNTFEIIKENDEYKIKDYYKEQGQFIMVYKLLDKEKDYSTQLEKIKSDYIDLFDQKKEKQNELYQEYLSNKNKEFKKCDHEYDRESATEYALKYVRVREYGSTKYDSSGGNCQNYASWVLHNGGIPMDKKGNYQWYNNTEVSGKAGTDKSGTWTAVGFFYNYAKYNTEYGLCASVDVNPYYAQKGDVVQIGYNNTFKHSAVVIDTYKKDNNVIEVILSSNTGDLEYYPFSAYPYPEKRLIKILGWNE